MKRIALFLSALLAAFPVWSQPTEKTNDQATEEGRQKNNELAQDAALTTKAHTALANDVGLPTMDRSNVDSDKRVVTLEGRVGPEAPKKRAEQVAKNVRGGAAAKNALQGQA